jgi:enoyl-CoA hydratase/carnithine racemase
MMAADDVLLVEIKGAIAHLTLNRPEKRNALNDDLVAALDAFLEKRPPIFR